MNHEMSEDEYTNWCIRIGGKASLEGEFIRITYFKLRKINNDVFNSKLITIKQFAKLLTGVYRCEANYFESDMLWLSNRLITTANIHKHGLKHVIIDPNSGFADVGLLNIVKHCV